MKRILLIEDNVDSADMLGMLLEHHGHSIQHAVSGRAGIALAISPDIDIIITDLGWPDTGGMQFVRNLRKAVQTRDCMIVALTGWDGVDIQQEAHRAGVDYFFVKGRDIGELLGLLDR